MRAAVTKIPHLLYEEDLLKTRMWCMILFTIWFMYNGYDGNGREKPRKVYIHENKEKIPRLVDLPSPPPSIKLEADCFPGRKSRKQAGPTLGGAGILIYRDKKIKGRARYGSIEAGNMIFYIWMFKIFNKSGLGFRLRYKNNREGEDLEKLPTRWQGQWLTAYC